MKRKKIALWTIGGIVALVLAVTITGVLFLEHNQKLRAYLLQRVQRSVEESTGARLTVRDFKVRFGGLRLDLYGLVVHGSEPDSQRPLLAADHLGVSIRIDSVLRRKWHLQDIIADHPVASISVKKTGGSNLPEPKTPSTGHTSIFDLAIDSVAIHHGEIYYNDQKSLMDVALQDLQLATSFDRGQSRYYGDLRYCNGRIQYGAYAPVAHNLEVRFELTPQNFTLNSAVLEAGKSRVTLTASIDNYANNQRLQATYDAILVTADVARILKNSSIPQGDVRLTGSLNYQSRPERPALESVALTGTLSSNELQISTSGIRTALHALAARYKIEQGNAEVDGIHAQILGGALDGKITVRDLHGRQQGKLLATFKGISVEQLQALSHSQPLQRNRLSGRIDADAEATWAKSLKNLIAHANATLAAALGQNPATPVNGTLHADYVNATQEVALHQSYVRTPQTSVILDGRVSTNSQLQIRMKSSNLHELELLAANFRSPSLDTKNHKSATQSLSAQNGAAQDLGLYGSASLDASVSGSITRPQVKGRLEASNLRIKDSSWKLLRTDISANPSSITLQNGELLAVTQGRFAFAVQAGLTQWSYMPSSPINIHLSASQLSVADLEKFTGSSYPVSGTLAMNVLVHGSQLNPVGQGNINLANALVSNEPIQNVSLTFQGNGNSVNANLVAHLVAGAAEANVTVDPRTHAYQFQLHAHNIHLEQLKAVKARNMQIAGELSLDASGHGTMDSPELEATLAVPQLQMQHQTVRGITLHTTIRNHVANISMDSEVAQTSVKAQGTIGIQAPYSADVHLDTGRIAIQPLVALYSPAQAANISGQTELHITLRGPLEDKTRVEAHLEIPVLTAAFKQLQIGSTRPIRADYRNGAVVLQPATIAGTGTNINMEANIPVNNPSAATGMLKGTVDLRIAQLLIADLESTGEIQFDIGSQRTGSGMNGQIRIVNASMHPVDIPVSLDHANGVINITPDRLDVSIFQGETGGGTITAKGSVRLRPAIQFGLALQGDNVRFRYPDGIRAILATNLTLTGTPQASVLAGQLQIQRISLTPDFDLASFTGQFGNDTSAPPAAGSFTQNMKLNVAVQSTSQMNLQSSQVSIRGNANLRVVGTAAEPVVLGRTNLTGGELFFGGNRYVVQNGTIDFLNAVRTEPIINLRAQTKISEYNITLGMQGPVTRLHTTYTSDPALPPADIINLIARGQTTEAAAAQRTQPLSLGAESLVASTVTSQIGGKIAKVAGISQLQIDPSLGASNGQNPGARIAIQQRVTSNLFVTFATDVTSTQRQAIEMEYKLNPRWSVSGVRDQNGGFSAQAHYRKKF